ncbi:hypothetical protein MJ561_15905 [Klebsiella pneumoniae]|nr:hypothetical protein MJ561_15905 [Klebsiella pneumoniae]
MRDPAKTRSYKAARDKGGFVRSAEELGIPAHLAAAADVLDGCQTRHVETASPRLLADPAMSMVSYAAGMCYR